MMPKLLYFKLFSQLQALGWYQQHWTWSESHALKSQEISTLLCVAPNG
jgi:hypothetical protein